MLNHVQLRTGRLWDSIEIPTKGTFPQMVKLFANPIGVPNLWSTGTRTIIDTNMEMANALPAPMGFEVKKIVLSFSNKCDEKDVIEIAENYVLKFWLQQKFFVNVPILHMLSTKDPLNPIKICEFCRSVFVMESRCPSCGAMQFTLTGMGEPGQQYVIDITQELNIVCQQYFQVTLESITCYTIKGDYFKLWVHLEGNEQIGVQ